MSLSLTYRHQSPRVATSVPPLLLLLHGYGSNEHDLLQLAPYLDGRCLIVSPRAPHQLAPGSYAWFDLGFTAQGYTVDRAEAEASRDTIMRFIDEIVATYGADAQQVYLLGFSQGAIMSASVALKEPDRVAGAVLMSGSVTSALLPDAAAQERLVGKPFLVVHGTQDPVLPIRYGRESRDVLGQLPIDLTYREYPMGHTISPESLTEVVAWLEQRLKA
jgi:phospholipase/carboxylesterase